MKHTLIISAFPGIGKSYLSKIKHVDILDSDSSTFDKANFPENYIQHIKDNIGKVDIILVSTHKEVREAMYKEKIWFVLVYPNILSKREFIKRYKDRGNTGPFIELLDRNWDEWLNELNTQRGCYHSILTGNQYLSDMIDFSVYSREVADDIIDRHHTEAKQILNNLDIEWRLVRVDGFDYILTSDYRPNRFGLVIRNNLVKEVKFG